jgi:hypothetical protein
MLVTGSAEHGRSAPAWSGLDSGTLTGENTPGGKAARSRTAKAQSCAWLAKPGDQSKPPPPSSRIGIGDLVGAFFGFGDAHVVTADFAGCGRTLSLALEQRAPAPDSFSCRTSSRSPRATRARRARERRELDRVERLRHAVDAAEIDPARGRGARLER